MVAEWEPVVTWLLPSLTHAHPHCFPGSSVAPHTFHAPSMLHSGCYRGSGTMARPQKGHKGEMVNFADICPPLGRATVVGAVV